MLRKELDDLTRATRSLLWGVLALLVGLIALVGIAVAIEVSDRIGFGLWGAAAVTVLAIVVGLLVFWRSGSAGPSPERHAGRDGQGQQTKAARGAKPTVTPTAPPKVAVTEIPPQLLSESQAKRRVSPAVAPPTADARPAAAPGAAAAPAPTPAPAPATPAASGDPAITRMAYYDAIEAKDVGQARQVLAGLREQGEDPAWCDNAQRRIDLFR